jgi:hypothetical protein
MESDSVQLLGNDQAWLVQPVECLKVPILASIFLIYM